MSASILQIPAAALATPRRRSNAVWLADPPRERPKTWLIDRLTRSPGIGFLSGRGNSGKSTVAVHLAFCLQEGKPFFGHSIPERGGTYFVDAEMQADFELRIEGPARRLGISRERRVLAHHETKPDLGSDAGLQAFKRELQEVSQEMLECWGMPLRLVVLDTFGQATIIQDENSAAHVNKAIGPLRLMARELGVVFLFTHHIKRGGENWKAMRGSEALRDNADFTLHIEHGKAVQEIYLDKCRHGLSGRTLGHFRLSVVDLSDIEVDATACAIEEVADWPPAKSDRKPKVPDAGPSGEKKPKADSKSAVSLKNADSADNIFLIAVEEVAGGGLTVETVKQRFNSLYRAAKGDVKESALNRAFSRAKTDALNAGHVKLDVGRLQFDAAGFEAAHPEMVTEEAKAMIAYYLEDRDELSPAVDEMIRRERKARHAKRGLECVLADFIDAAEWSLDCAAEEGATPGVLFALEEPHDLGREFSCYMASSGTLSASSLERAFKYALKVATEGPGARFELKNGRLAYRSNQTS